MIQYQYGRDWTYRHIDHHFDPKTYKFDQTTLNEILNETIEYSKDRYDTLTLYGIVSKEQCMLYMKDQIKEILTHLDMNNYSFRDQVEDYDGIMHDVGGLLFGCEWV